MMKDDLNKVLGIIGGSQAYTLLSEGAFSGQRIGPLRTPFGSSQPIYRIPCDGSDFFLLSRHGENKYSVTPSSANYRANIYALKDCGVTHIVAWSGPGSLNKEISPGLRVVVDDIIDETSSRVRTFFEHRGVGFIRMSEPFCPSLRTLIIDTLRNLSIDFASHATYVCTEGPRIETPAEIKKYQLLGGDLVGMTLAPEVFLAKELELCYGAICYVTNFAEGLKKTHNDPDLLFGGLANQQELKIVDDAVNQFPAIIRELATRLSGSSQVCTCPHTMSRYKHSGRLSHDWRRWFE